MTKPRVKSFQALCLVASGYVILRKSHTIKSEPLHTTVYCSLTATAVTTYGIARSQVKLKCPLRISHRRIILSNPPVAATLPQLPTAGTLRECLFMLSITIHFYGSINEHVPLPPPTITLLLCVAVMACIDVPDAIKELF
uniref:Uncharacterized protein n=1 Tax=Lygus hesperus TaxID=30085 RepID=A0A146MF70_LYGHE